VSVRVLILIQLTGGVGVPKQSAACLDYIKAEGHNLKGFLRAGSTPVDAAKAIANGQADVVVAAYRTENELTGEIQRAGGSVEYVQKPRNRVTVRGIIARLYRVLGLSPAEIATLVEANANEVRDHLRRSGIEVDRRE
jgi:hypothetical protein